MMLSTAIWQITPGGRGFPAKARKKKKKITQGRKKNAEVSQRRERTSD
jgi:hypothetical protein